MATDKTTKNLYQKLLTIQKHINGLGKDKSGGQFRYVTGDKVLEHIKPKMNDLGLILKQEVISIENTRQDYKTNSGEKSEINSKVMLRFTWVDADTGEIDENMFGANGQNGWDKGVGSALTYAERYFLLKYFHIATDEDDIDNPDRQPAGAEIKAATVMQVQTEPASKATIDALLLNLEGFKGLYKAEDLTKLKTTIANLTADKEAEISKKIMAGVTKRILEGRSSGLLNHAASTAQLDLIDKMLLSRVFTAEEKAAFNTASYEYDNIDAANRIDWLTVQMKARKSNAAAA